MADGSVVEIPGVGLVTFPGSMSADEINVAAKRLHDEAHAPAAKAPAEWSELPGNILPSAGRFALDTLKGAGTVLRMAGRSIVDPQTLYTGLGLDASKAWEHKGAIASAAKEAIANRYGSPAALKETLITDPVGIVSDVASIALPVAGAGLKATRVPRLVNAGAKIAAAGDALDLSGQAVKLAARPVQAGARRVVAQLAGPTAQQQRAMAGGRGVDKAGRVVDTILDNRLWSDQTAGRQIGAIDDVMTNAMVGPAGDLGRPDGRPGHAEPRRARGGVREGRRVAGHQGAGGRRRRAGRAARRQSTARAHRADRVDAAADGPPRRERAAAHAPRARARAAIPPHAARPGRPGGRPRHVARAGEADVRGPALGARSGE